MKKPVCPPLIAKFWRSKRALAIPMTFLILFVTTLGLISVTYYFSVERVNAQSQTLKVATAKQDILAIDQKVLSVVAQPGAARTIEIADSGGKLKVQPSANSLAVGISDGTQINTTIYNQTVGQVAYELPYADTPDTGFYLRGDSRTVANQSGAVMTQLCVTNGLEHVELLLRYRPQVTVVSAGVENNRTVNTLRVYVVNLNASDAVSLYGKVPLRISCESTQVATSSYTVNYAIQTLSVTAAFDEESGGVVVPLSSTAQGAVINVEIVECNVNIERCLL